MTGEIPGPGSLVVVAGFGVTGRAVAQVLLDRGCRVLVTADRRTPALPAELMGSGNISAVADLTGPPPDTALIVVSPGFPPASALRRAAADRGIEVIGEVELAWRLDRRSTHARHWVAVTATNGKTTTIGMLESILRAANRRVTACGNVGWPVISAVTDQPVQDVIAAELSSFQLHDAPSLRLTAGAVLNLAPDHLDWYSGADPTADPMAEYAADKARALTGDVAVAVVDDPGAAALLAASSAARRVPVTAGPPGPGGLGVTDGRLVDRAFGAGVLLDVAEIRPAGAHNVTNALAAAALALAVGVGADQVAAGLRTFTPGAHRNVVIAEHAGVQFVDDSKATNPHAAAASMSAYPRFVWIAGGQLKGAEVSELVERFADRLAGAVVIGVDAPVVLAALSRHAPDVPVIGLPGTDDGVMTEVVRAAMAMARDKSVEGGTGDGSSGHGGGAPVVLLAPAAASLDMFDSYAHRGRAFAAAVADLGVRG